MKIEMSYLLLAFATVLAPMAQGQSTPPQPKITGVLTILSPKPEVTPERVMKIMPAEIRATVPLYLDGKIQQWFTRGDGRGVIFILNCKDVAEARALIESLPLSKENLIGRAVYSGRATLAARDSSKELPHVAPVRHAALGSMGTSS